MEVYRNKVFNPEVFEKYLKTLPSTKENGLILSSVFKKVSKYGALLNEQTGGYYITEPIKGRIGGTAQNYDGETNITSSDRPTYYQGKVAIGRDNAWGEYDFVTELTGTNFMAEAGEVKEYWDEELQTMASSILSGIFKMDIAKSDGVDYDFVGDHTYIASGELGADDCNKAAQKALGDKKANLKVMIMNSAVSTQLESLQLINFLKYTDKQGIERDLTIGTYNGRLVIVDDDMSKAVGYVTSTEGTEGALKVVSDDATPSTGEITVSSVKAFAFYPSTVKADDYVLEAEKYVTYMFSEGFFELEELGVKVPSEVYRQPMEKGGHTDLISRKRWVIVPQYISFTQKDLATHSPTNEELATGTNWEVANNGLTNDSRKCVPSKLIPVVRILSE